MSNPLLWGGPMHPPEYWAETCPVCDVEYLPGKWRHECTDEGAGPRVVPASWMWDEETSERED